MAASVIQEAVSGASLTAGSATTITASITISAGSRLKATAIGDTGTAATATFSDNSGQGVTWTSHGGPLNISNVRMFDGSSLQFPSGATITVTCTFASAMSTRGLLLQEVAGADNNAVQDAKSQTQNPLSSGTDVITTPSMTATGAGLVVGVTRNNGGANLTAGTGFTGGTLRWNGSGDPTLGESKHVAAGATAATWSTTSSGGAWWSTAVIFGDAAGAAPPAPSADPAPRLPPPKRARTTDFTVPPQQGVPGGTGFAPPERAVRVTRWLPPPRIEVLPPMAAAPPTPTPEPPRALPIRRPMPAPNGDAIPPPASVFTGSGFAPPERAVVALRRLPPPTSDALPPMAAAAPPPPPPEGPRALPRRGPAAVAYQPPVAPPLPPVVFGPPPPAPFVVRAFRRIRQWISEVGWPSVAAPPPGPSLPPPFTTVVDPVTFSTWVDSVLLTVAVDAVRLSLGERLKPRKTTDTYPITNTLVSNGVAVNLTGYTVTINIVERASRNPKRANGACTLTDAVNGKVSYQVVAGDVDTAGSYDVEWKAVSGGGVPYHFPQDGYEPLEIQPALG